MTIKIPRNIAFGGAMPAGWQSAMQTTTDAAGYHMFPPWRLGMYDTVSASDLEFWYKCDDTIWHSSDGFDGTILRYQYDSERLASEAGFDDPKPSNRVKREIWTAFDCCHVEGIQGGVTEVSVGEMWTHRFVLKEGPHVIRFNRFWGIR